MKCPDQMITFNSQDTAYNYWHSSKQVGRMKTPANTCILLNVICMPINYTSRVVIYYLEFMSYILRFSS